MSKDKPEDDTSKAPKERAYAEFNKKKVARYKFDKEKFDKEKLDHLWKKDEVPQTAKQSSKTDKTSLKSSGSETSRVHEESGSSTFRASEDSGSSTSRTLDTSSSESSEKREPTNFSKIRSAEKWEENILALDKGEQPADPNFKVRGQLKSFASAKDALKLDVKTTEKEMDRISQLFEKIDIIKQYPSRLRHFLADADKCAKNMKALEMPRAKEFQESIQSVKEAYKTELRRAAYAASHKQKKDSAEKATDSPTSEPPKFKR